MAVILIVEANAEGVCKDYPRVSYKVQHPRLWRQMPLEQ